MQTDNRKLLDVLGTDGIRFVIPAYQRLYAWKERQCRELWQDIHRAARGNRSHFVGTLLYSDEGPDEAGIRRWAVVDGQQRLTTMTLIMVAFARYLDACAKGASDADASGAGVADADAPDKGDSACGQGIPDAGELRRRFLLAGSPAGPSAKLTLSRTDAETMAAVIRTADIPWDEAKGELPARASANVVDNLEYFQQLMDEDEFDPALLWQGLNRLFVIAAEPEAEDNAQLIFESLNSKGLPLTTADLVRNFLLLAESHAEQTRLYDTYWAPIEEMFAPDPGSLRLDNAIQGWLSVRFRKVRAKGAAEVYGVFKLYVEDEFTGTTESLLNELMRFCMVWAENYRYHAVKKFRSNFNWATNGAQTLVSDVEKQAPASQQVADGLRRAMDDVDARM